MKEVAIAGAKTPDEERLMTYLICAELWGWTPEQVDRQPITLLRDLLVLTKEVKEEERRKLEAGRI